LDVEFDLPWWNAPDLIYPLQSICFLFAPPMCRRTNQLGPVLPLAQRKRPGQCGESAVNGVGGEHVRLTFWKFRSSWNRFCCICVRVWSIRITSFLNPYYLLHWIWPWFSSICAIELLHLRRRKFRFFLPNCCYLVCFCPFVFLLFCFLLCWHIKRYASCPRPFAGFAFCDFLHKHVKRGLLDSTIQWRCSVFALHFISTSPFANLFHVVFVVRPLRWYNRPEELLTCVRKDGYNVVGYFSLPLILMMFYANCERLWIKDRHACLLRRQLELCSEVFSFE
jgi:hypothetical protein